MTRIVFFNKYLINAGGAERLMLEEAKYLKKMGIDVHILTFNFNEKVLFNGTYNVEVIQIGDKLEPKLSLSTVLQEMRSTFVLRKKLKELQPDAIISTSAGDCRNLYIATLFTHIPYVTHIHGTMFWFHNDMLKYAFIHRKVFHDIRESVFGHREFISEKPPKINILMTITNEVVAFFTYNAVRKAKKIFVLSNQMKWEVEKLYGKEAIVLKGAFPSNIFNYKIKINIKKRLKLENKKVILNINRLDVRKRVDLLIKSFAQVLKKIDDVILIIGGTGPDEQNLKNLVKKLEIQDYVKFVGYIPENELWDYYACCDVFVHPNWADFAIAVYEALALHKKVVCSSEMDIDKELLETGMFFLAEPTVDKLEKSIEKALKTDTNIKYDISRYSWDKYCQSIMDEIKKFKKTKKDDIYCD